MTKNQAMNCSTNRTAHTPSPKGLAKKAGPGAGKPKRNKRKRKQKRTKKRQKPRFYRKPQFEAQLADELSTDDSSGGRGGRPGAGEERSLGCQAKNMKVQVRGEILLNNVSEASRRRFFACATSLKAPEPHVLSAPLFL